MNDSEVRYNKRKVYKRAITSSIGFFIMGYHFNVFNSSQTCVSKILDWGENEELFIAIMTAMAPFGALFGVLSSGYLTKYFGKRSLLIYTNILTIIGSLLCYFPNTITFGVGRFIVGFTSGNYSTICSQYTTEFTPTDIYSKIGFIGPVNGVISTFASNVVCLGLPTTCYPSEQYYIFLIFLVPGIFASVQLYMLLRVFRRESPKWLIQKKNYELALHSYESIYNKDFAETEITKLKTLEKTDEQNFTQNNQEERFIDLICCKTGTTKGMRIGTLMHMANQLSGVSFVMFYSTLIYQDVGEGIFLARLITAIGSFIRIPPVILLLPHVPKVSAKVLVVLGHTCMGCNLLIIAFLFEVPGLVYLVVINVYIFVILYGCTLFPVTWAYSSLVMPDKGMSLGAGMQWVMSTLVLLFSPFLINLLGIKYTFLMYSGVNFLAAFYMYIDVVDVRGKSKQEVRELFSKFR